MRLFGTLIKRLLQIILIPVVAVIIWMYINDATLATRIISLALTGSGGPEQSVAGSALPAIPVADKSQTISREAIQAALTYGETTGSHALLVYQNGALQLEHYFPGYDANSVTSTASMHKSVLGLLIGIAIDQGHIESVDEPASRYLSEWANDERAAITIKQLLRQTSGIDFPTFSFNPTGGFFQFMLGEDITGITLSQQQWAAPGTRFDYNNVGPQALGIILQRATGQNYANYLSKNLWKKIGADDATVQIDAEATGMARTFCCINATARSWLRVGLLHIQEGRFNGTQVVPQEWISEMTQPGTFEPNYGYLTWLGTEYKPEQRYNRKGSAVVPHSEPYAAEDVVYFDGFGGQRMYAIPSLNMVIVRTGDISMDWDDAYLPNTLIRGLQTR